MPTEGGEQVSEREIFNQNLALVDSILARQREDQVVLTQQIRQNERGRHRMIVEYLGGNESDIVAKHAEAILSFAEKEQTDPQWLYAQVIHVGIVVTYDDHKPEKVTYWPQFSSGALFTATDYYTHAIGLIQSDDPQFPYGYRRPVKDSLKKAEELSQADEAMRSDEIPTDRKESIKYKWLRKNCDMLYDIWTAKSQRNYP